jgi:large subunit ribosomal protein L21
MFAVIETGGKQYRVEPGEVIDVELMESVAPETDRGAALRFERVLMVGGGEVTVGSPAIEGAVVTASLVGDAKGPKIRVFKHKRRNTQRRTRGHRQHYHRVRIDEIQLP